MTIVIMIITAGFCQISSKYTIVLNKNELSMTILKVCYLKLTSLLFKVKSIFEQQKQGLPYKTYK